MRERTIDRDAIRAELESDQRFSAAYLFGSAAKDELRSNSDVDLAVMYADDNARGSVEAELLDVLGHLSYSVDGREIHLVDLEAAGPSLRMQVFRKGICLFERDGDRVRRLLKRTLTEWFDWEYARRVIDSKLDQRFRSTARARTNDVPREGGEHG